jgi:hypothetical protein
VLDRLSHGPAYAIKHHLRDYSNLIREILAAFRANLPSMLYRFTSHLSHINDLSINLYL